MTLKKKKNLRVGGIGSALRALAALAKNTGSVSSNHMWVLNHW